MKNLNAREKNYLTSLLLETITKKKEQVIQEIEQINSQKQTKANPRLSHLKEERRLLNAILSKIVILWRQSRNTAKSKKKRRFRDKKDLMNEWQKQSTECQRIPLFD